MIYGSDEINIVLMVVDELSSILVSPCGVPVSPTAPADVKIDDVWHPARFGMLPNGFGVVGFKPKDELNDTFKAKIVCESYNRHDDEEVHTVTMTLIDQTECPICSSSEDDDDDDDDDEEEDGPPNRITPFLVDVN